MVRNLGVIFDSSLNFNKQVSSVVKGSFCQLRTVAKLKPFFIKERSWNSNSCFCFLTLRLL